NKKLPTPPVAAWDDPELRVVNKGGVALTQISRHSFKDDEAYPQLLKLMHSDHPLTTRWVIDALIQLRGEASLEDVLPLCADPSQEARAMVFHHLYSWLVATRTAGGGAAP